MCWMGCCGSKGSECLSDQLATWKFSKSACKHTVDSCKRRPSSRTASPGLPTTDGCRQSAWSWGAGMLWQVVNLFVCIVKWLATSVQIRWTWVSLFPIAAAGKAKKRSSRDWTGAEKEELCTSPSWSREAATTPQGKRGWRGRKAAGEGVVCSFYHFSRTRCRDQILLTLTLTLARSSMDHVSGIQPLCLRVSLRIM